MMPFCLLTVPLQKARAAMAKKAALVNWKGARRLGKKK